MLVTDELRCPHLVPADTGAIDRVRTGDRADAPDRILRGERSVGRRLVPQGGGLLPAPQRLPPGLVVAAPPCVVLSLDGHHEIRDHFPAVANDRNVSDAVL